MFNDTCPECDTKYYNDEDCVFITMNGECQICMSSEQEITPAEVWAIEIENELAVIVDPDGDKIVLLDDVAEFIADLETKIKATAYTAGFKHGLALPIPALPGNSEKNAVSINWLEYNINRMAEKAGWEYADKLEKGDG